MKIRCDLLKDLHGKVLELGPGPATNAECFVGKPISHYTGIEPNRCVRVKRLSVRRHSPFHHEHHFTQTHCAAVPPN